MKYLADENFSNFALQALLKLGVDIVRLPTGMQGSPDAAVLQLAESEERILATFDKDFGELIFRRSAGSIGVVLFRLEANRSATARRICDVLTTGHDFNNRLTVVEFNRIRSRRFPDTLDPEE